RSSSASTLLPAARTAARRRSGWRAITSSADEPIEPVAPRTATDCIVEAGVVEAGMSEAEQFLAQQEHRQRGEHAVEAVEDAAVPRDHVARILGPDVALEQALEQVADHREQHRRLRHQR